MMKVMLIGDSIRLSYEARVRELLKGRAVIEAPAENCRFAAYTLFNLSGWAPDGDYDVIHWNNGQWDSCYMPDGRIHTPLGIYVDLEKRIAEILSKKGRRLVFATTTPVHPNQFATAAVNGRTNEDIKRYNQAAREALEPMGIEINDLHAAVASNVAQYISEDMVHLSPAGVETCAIQVADRLVG